MKFTLLCILLVIAATPSVIAQVKNAQTVSNNKTEQELINLTRMWDEAVVKRDVKRSIISYRMITSPSMVQIMLTNLSYLLSHQRFSTILTSEK